VTDLGDLPFTYPDESPPTNNGAKGARPCRRHSWRQSPFEGEGVVCWKCGKPKDGTASRRGRTSLRAGKDAERAIAKSYGGTRTGQYGGPDDVTVGDLFVIQSKAGARFPGWMWDELAKLPRAGGRIPTLIVSDRPGPGHRTRRLVVRTIEDDLDLHGPDAA
jgi:hypothetical protein